MAFAEKLKMHRAEMALTQGELASRIGVSQKTVSSWEVGRSEPTMKEITKLCHLFDCTLEDLTDTRIRKLGEISIDDIYEKINSLSFDELCRLEKTVSERIKLVEKLNRAEKEKKELENQINRLETYIKQFKQGKLF